MRWTRLISSTRTGDLWAGAVRPICWTVAGGSGRPGFRVSSACCRSKGTDAGGGAVRATTGRLNTLAGGRGARDASPARGPRTLARCGAISGAATMRAVPNWAADTARPLSATRRPLANLSCGTAVTAFATVWFAYLMLAMEVLLEFRLSL